MEVEEPRRAGTAEPQPAGRLRVARLQRSGTRRSDASRGRLHRRRASPAPSARDRGRGRRAPARRGPGHPRHQPPAHGRRPASPQHVDRPGGHVRGRRAAEVPLARLARCRRSGSAIYVKRGEGDSEALEQGLSVLRAGRPGRHRAGGAAQPDASAPASGRPASRTSPPRATRAVVPVAIWGQERMAQELAAPAPGAGCTSASASRSASRRAR